MSTYKFKVEMTCEGCSGAVTRILSKKLEDGETFDIDLPGKLVTVTTPSRSQEEVFEMLKKSGKEVTKID